MVKTLGQLYQDARRLLQCREDRETAAFMARALLCHITGRTREQLLSQQEIYICEADCRAVEEGVQRLLADEPLAYVLGEWDFYGMTLTVNKNVLIPRDDTCAVTDLAICEAKKRGGRNPCAGFMHRLRLYRTCGGEKC